MSKRSLFLAGGIAFLLGTSALAETQFFYRTEPGFREATGEVPSAFSPAAQPVALSGLAGSPVSARLGSYSGTGWSCDAISGASWLSCSFASGVATIAGTSSSAVNGVVDVVVRGLETSSTVRVALDVRSAVSFAPAGNPVLVDGEANKPLATLLGTRSGGSTWSCGPVPGLDWASCRLGTNGVIDLVGSPNRVVSGNFAVPVYESGSIVANVPASVNVIDGTPSATYDVATIAGNDRIAQPGQAFVFPLATYTSSDDGWSCQAASGSISPWVSCRFAEGRFALTGTAGSEGSDSTGARYLIRKAGTSYGGTPAVVMIRSVARTVTGGPETTETPRPAAYQTGTFQERVFSPGQVMDVDLGAVTGGREGFSCYSNSQSLWAGTSCHVADGRSRLVGVAPAARTSRSFRIVSVKDGIALGSTSNARTFSVEERVVTGGPEDGSAPRPATFTVAASPDHRSTRVFQPGQTVEMELGSLTGGPEGVSCYSTSPSLMWPGFACHEDAGKLFLRGTAPSVNSDRTGFTYVVKDTVRLGLFGQGTIKTETRTITGGPETPNSPRGGRFTAGTVANASFQAGTPVDILLGKLDVTDPSGTSCYMTNRTMPSGLACHNEGGDVRLRGMAPSGSGSFTSRIAVVRDTVELGQTNQFTITFTN